MSLLFLTYGTTHSGKTTFGARLHNTLGESAAFIHVDNDVADEFIKQNYNNLRTDPKVLARRNASDPDLRLLIPQLVTGYALREGYSVIVTAAHPKQVIRQTYYDIAASSGAKVVLLMFRVSEEQALQRIQKNNRSTEILGTSPSRDVSFHDLFAEQTKAQEEPTDSEKQSCLKVFEVTEDNVDEVLEAVVDLARSAAVTD